MKRFFLRLGINAPDQVSWAEVQEDGTVDVRMGSLDEAALVMAGKRVNALVPSQDVVLMSAKIPKGGRKQEAQAVPYAIEEQYISEAEELHFSLGGRERDGMLSLALVDRVGMDSWLAMVRNVGIDPYSMVSEVLALPFHADGWTVLVDGPVTLVRTGTQSGFAVDTVNFDAVFCTELLGQEGLDSLRIHLYAPDVFMPPPAELISPHTYVSEPFGEVMALLVAGFGEKGALDLLQGPYNRHAQWGKLFRQWQLPLVALLIFIVLRGGLLGYEYHGLRWENQDLSSRIEKIYRDLFPQSKHLVDPKAQMQQKLVELRGKGDGGGGFLNILEKCTDLLLQAPGFDLQNMRYKDGQLDLDFLVDSLQVLDDLKGRLAELEGLAVEIRTASAKEDSVEARIQIREAG